jgi:hypothetical protein
MMRPFVIAAALMFTASCGAYGRCAPDVFYTSQKEDGTTVGLVATDADMARDPAWTPGHGEPPMSPARAYDLALAWARANWKHYDSFGLRDIDLTSVGCDSSPTKWLYVVSLVPVINGNRLYRGLWFIGVFMDGSIIVQTPVKKDF